MIKEIHDIDVRQELMKSKTLRDLDHHVTSRLFGYSSVDDYYEKVGCGQNIHLIKSPTLFIQSLDDTIVGPHCFPRPSAFL